MRKKLISLAVAVIMIITMVPAVAMADANIGNTEGTVLTEGDQAQVPGTELSGGGENTGETVTPGAEGTADPESTEPGEAVDPEVPASEEIPEGETPADGSGEVLPETEPVEEPEITPEITPEVTPTPEITPDLIEELSGESVDIAEGYYRITSKLASNLVLAVEGRSTANHANVCIEKSDCTDGQIFYIKPDTDSKGNKFYYIQSLRSSKYLHVNENKAANGTNIKQYAFKGVNAQKWIATKGVNGGVVFHSKLSKGTNDFVLDVAGGKAVSGRNVDLFKANNTLAQEWRLSALTVNPFSEGIYIINSASQKTKAVDVKSGSTANGANVQLYTDNGSHAQIFKVEDMGGGYYRFWNINARKVIDIKGGSKAAGANIDIYSYNGSAAQLFRVIPTGQKTKAGDDMYQILSKSGMFMGFKGSNIQTAAAGGTNATKWTFKATTVPDNSKITSGMYKFLSKANDTKALNVADSSVANGGNIQIMGSNNNNSQKFKITPAGDGYIYITSVLSGKVLNVKGASFKNGTNLQQYTNDKTKAVKFKLEDTGDNDGSVYIRTYNNKFVVDLAGGKTADKTNVQIYTLNKSNAQKFYPVKTTTSKGWQIIGGKRRYVKDGSGNYYKNTTVPDGSKVGADGTALAGWVVQNGYWRYRLSNGTFVNDTRPYLVKLFGGKKVVNAHGKSFEAPICDYYATVDRVRCRVTIYTKYPGTSNWNLPVCSFVCSPGTNSTPTDAGLWHTTQRAGVWAELMGPSYGQYATRIHGGELFHSVACGQMNRTNLSIGAYNALGTKQSHGCVRLDVRNAYWIYTFCPVGMPTYVGDNLAYPISNVPQPKMRSGAIDPTDPYYTGNYGYTDTNVYYGSYYF